VGAIHGSPRSDMEYLLEAVTPTGARPATTDEVVERLGNDRETTLLLCGHTHIQRLIQVPGGPLIVNPGSVGWPAYADDLPYPHVRSRGVPRRVTPSWSWTATVGGVSCGPLITTGSRPRRSASRTAGPMSPICYGLAWLPSSLLARPMDCSRLILTSGMYP
jgi:hypothetical protein